MTLMTRQDGIVGGASESAFSRRFRVGVTSPVTAVAAVWVCSALLAVFAPDMVTGSEREHLPITAMTVWLWTFAATAYIAMAARRTTSAWLVWGVVSIWVSVLVAGVAAPLMVTGADPTEIPIAALLTPPVGALATGLVALHHATRQDLGAPGSTA